MSDDALMAWLGSGAQVELTAAEAASRRHSEFSLRFVDAMNPPSDLGSTEESHELAVAERVYAVHEALRAHGIETYDAVWVLLSAPVRRALKAYIAMKQT